MDLVGGAVIRVMRLWQIKITRFLIQFSTAVHANRMHLTKWYWKGICSVILPRKPLWTATSTNVSFSSYNSLFLLAKLITLSDSRVHGTDVLHSAPLASSSARPLLWVSSNISVNEFFISGEKQTVVFCDVNELLDGRSIVIKADRYEALVPVTRHIVACPMQSI